jgi:1A family penicillin-binding protein
MVPKNPKKPSLVADKRSFPEKRAKKPKPAKRKAVTKSKSSAKKRKPSIKKRGFISRFFRGIVRLSWYAFSRIAAIFLLVLGGATFAYYSQLPDASVLMDDRQRGSVTLTDEAGKVFAWRGDQFGGLVSASTVSPHLRNAVVATEDKRFYGHWGLSIRGIAGAIRTNLREGRSPLSGHGGSTITQQVAKRVYFEDLPSRERKLKEVPMSLAMELKYSKDEILSIYLNRAYLGAGSYGFEAAAQRYFGKSARDVVPAEAAMLAGLLKAPSRYAPTRNMGRARGRAELILGLMKDQNLLTQAQINSAINNPAQLSEVAERKAGGYFADWIMESAPDFLIKDTTEDVIIKTTFDKRIQTAAEDALAYIFENKVREGSKAQAAIIVMSKDGAVRGMVGGRNLGVPGGFNRATQALRQTGSSFKPFVYAAALESGYSYNTIVEDSAITVKTRGQADWTPRNYTNEFKGNMPLTQALAESINTVAVRLSEEIGRPKVKALATDFGITSEIQPVPAMALGASESTLLEMTGAYAGILNSGHLAVPYGVERITIQGDSTPLMGKVGGTGHRIINDKAAETLIYMMNQVIEVGSGKRAKLDDREIAGKTGTTQGARDAWFIGFSADYVAGVWMGYDDNSKLSGVTGGGLPADIWKETMVRVHEGLPSRELPMLRPAPNSERQAEDVNNILEQLQADLREAKDDLKNDLGQLENEAENILGQVLRNIFKKKN